MKNTNYLQVLGQENKEPLHYVFTDSCSCTNSTEEIEYVCNHAVKVIVEPDIIITFCSKCGEILDTVVRKKVPENSPCPTSPTISAPHVPHLPTTVPYEPVPSCPTVEPTPWWVDTPWTPSNAITGTDTSVIYANVE